MSKITEIKQQVLDVKAKAGEISAGQDFPAKTQSASDFLKKGGSSLYFIFSEKENIMFAFLQLLTIAIGYYVWVQFLSWIPQEIWDELAANRGKCSDHKLIINLIFLVWSFVCVGVAAYPLGILTACMAASYLLRFQRKDSTIASCLKVVLPNSWTLWIFSWFDGWWTVNRIMERLPSKNRPPLAVRLLHEVVYQGWKAASLGFMPAILSGRGLINAGKDSVNLLKDNFRSLVKLRMGYSLVCWVFGVIGYLLMLVCGVYYVVNTGKNLGLFDFYFLAGFPLVAVLTFIMLIFRPIYIISACRLYAFYAKEKNIEIKLPENSPKYISSFAAFVILIALIIFVCLFRDELGITKILSTTLF